MSKETRLIFERGRPGRRGTSLPAAETACEPTVSPALRRAAPTELPEVSEQDTVRHYVNLSRKNMGVDTNFYPLGSCTMKYNPKFTERIAAMPGFANLHPLLPQLRQGGQLTQGALAVLYEMEQLMSEILGFRAFSMQPMAGSHGEFTGILMIAAYHRKNGDTSRRTMLIPDSAHGTNPASASIAGFDVVELPSNDDGHVDLDELKAHLDETTAGIMLTCPSTVGLFDPNTKEICRLVHEAGGLCYGDGANLNALLGRVRPGDLGFDCMHSNLHKTFATPHGGGGPGSGIIGVNRKLVPFLPTSRVIKRRDGSYYLNYHYKDSIGYIAPFYGNFAVILKAYAYILALGREGLVRVSENAVLNANYLRQRLQGVLDIPFDKACMHECVASAESLQKEHGVTALDLAKGLLDAGYHAPTVYFPLTVPECLMIEPTETESKDTLDAFVEALEALVKQAGDDPESLHELPQCMPVTRLDETRAARQPDLAY